MSIRSDTKCLGAILMVGGLLIGCPNEIRIEENTGTSGTTETASSGSAGSGGTGGMPSGSGANGGSGQTTTGSGGFAMGSGGAGGVAGVGGNGGVAGVGGSGGVAGNAGNGGSGGTVIVSGPGDVLDPHEVYLAGTLSEGACYRGALAHWSQPNGATVGFDCYFDEQHATIRPADGRLLYMNTFEEAVREFHCDACTYEGTYPNKPSLNDPILSPVCGMDNFYGTFFLVSPDGTILRTCTDNPLVWYDANGNIAYDNGGYKLLHLGYGNLALAAGRVVDLGTMSFVDITGLPYAPIVTARAVLPDGFWVVVDRNQQSPTGEQELWQIDASGTATLTGAFPSIPMGYTATAASSRLDASGVLFQFGRVANTFEDVIFRRTLGGTTEIVYKESDNPLVKIHISALVTGP